MLLGCSTVTPATKAITVPSSCLSAVTNAYPDNYDYVNLYLSSPGLDYDTISGLQDDTVSPLSVKWQCLGPCEGGELSSSPSPSALSPSLSPPIGATPSVDK
jgi:hypothetical protein